MRQRTTIPLRDVDFNKITDILHIVNENNGLLKAGELERIGIEKRILIKRNGDALSRSPRYFYRKVMENLNLIRLEGRHYYISTDNRVKRLLQTTKMNEPISDEVIEIYSQIIVENGNCRKFFFDLFIGDDSYNLDDIRSRGTPIIAQTGSSNDENLQTVSPQIDFQKSKIQPIVLIGKNGSRVVLNTQDKIFAIFEGVRKWSEKLRITDELMISSDEGRVIFPINPLFDASDLREMLIEEIAGQKHQGPWSVIYLPTFIRKVVLQNRYSITSVKGFLADLRKKYPNYVMPISSSTAFIDISSPFEKHNALIRKLYLFQNEEGYISHLRLRKEILEELTNEKCINGTKVREVPFVKESFSPRSDRN